MFQSIAASRILNDAPSEASTSSRKSFRGSRGPEAGVRGIPSPFIKIYERGRDTPHPSFLPLLLPRKDFLDELLDPTGVAPIERPHQRVLDPLARLLLQKATLGVGDVEHILGTLADRHDLGAVDRHAL